MGICGFFDWPFVSGGFGGWGLFDGLSRNLVESILKIGIKIEGKCCIYSIFTSIISVFIQI